MAAGGAKRFAVVYDGPRPDAFRALLTGLAPLVPWATAPAEGDAPLYGREGADDPRLYVPPGGMESGVARDRWLDGVGRWALGTAAGGSLVTVLDASRPDAAAATVARLAARRRAEVGAVEVRSAAVLVARGDAREREDAVAAVAAAVDDALGDARTASVLADRPLLPWPIVVLDRQGRWDRPLEEEETEGMAALWALALGSRHPTVTAWEGEHLGPLVATRVAQEWSAGGGEGCPPVFATGRLAILLDPGWVKAAARRLRQAEERLEGRGRGSGEDPRAWAERVIDKIEEGSGLAAAGIPIEDEGPLLEALMAGLPHESERRLLSRHGVGGVEAAALAIRREVGSTLEGWRADLVRGAASLASVRARLGEAEELQSLLEDRRRTEETRQAGRGGREQAERLTESVAVEAARRKAAGDDLVSWFPEEAELRRWGGLAVGAVAALAAWAASWPWAHEPAGWQVQALLEAWSGATGLDDAIRRAWWEVALERQWEGVLTALEPATAAAAVERAGRALLWWRLGWGGLCLLVGGLAAWAVARVSGRERSKVREQERAWRASRDGAPLQAAVLAASRDLVDKRHAFMEGGLRMMGIAAAQRVVAATQGRLGGLAKTLEAVGDGIEATRGRLEALASGDPGFFSNLDPISLARHRPAPVSGGDPDPEAWEGRLADPGEIPGAIDEFLGTGEPPRAGWVAEVDLGAVASLRRGGEPGEVLYSFGPAAGAGDAVLQAARGGEAHGAETPIPVAGAPSALAVGLVAGLGPGAAGRREGL